MNHSYHMHWTETGLKICLRLPELMLKPLKTETEQAMRLGRIVTGDCKTDPSPSNTTCTSLQIGNTKPTRILKRQHIYFPDTCTKYMYVPSRPAIDPVDAKYCALLCVLHAHSCHNHKVATTGEPALQLYGLVNIQA